MFFIAPTNLPATHCKSDCFCLANWRGSPITIIYHATLANKTTNKDFFLCSRHVLLFCFTTVILHSSVFEYFREPYHAVFPTRHQSHSPLTQTSNFHKLQWTRVKKTYELLILSNILPPPKKYTHMFDGSWKWNKQWLYLIGVSSCVLDLKFAMCFGNVTSWQ